jgi:hypothetical protein
MLVWERNKLVQPVVDEVDKEKKSSRLRMKIKAKE